MLKDQYLKIVEYKPNIQDDIIGELVDKIRSISYPSEGIESEVDESARKFSHHLVDLDEFRVATRNKPKRYSKKTIIVDELGFYVPYHYDINRYGVYLRVRSLLKDFYGLLEEARSLFKDKRYIRILSEESESNLIKVNKAKKINYLAKLSLYRIFSL